MELEVISRLPESRKYETPLLFVHGMFCGAWCWDEYFLPYFAEKGFEAHALSLRNHGGSGSKGSLRWCRIRDYARDLEQVAAGLPSPPVLIGHSMGGAIVQHYLAANKAPAGVLLASVPHSGLWRVTWNFTRRHPLTFLKCNLTMRMKPVLGNPELARDLFFHPDMPDDELNRIYGMIQDESYLAYLSLMFPRLPRPGEEGTPLLVLGAEKDRAVFPSQVKDTASAYGIEEPYIFPDMAHLMMLEKDWRDVADMIIDWLVERGIG